MGSSMAMHVQEEKGEKKKTQDTQEPSNDKEKNSTARMQYRLNQLLERARKVHALMLHLGQGSSLFTRLMVGRLVG